MENQEEVETKNPCRQVLSVIYYSASARFFVRYNGKNFFHFGLDSCYQAPSKNLRN